MIRRAALLAALALLVSAAPAQAGWRASRAIAVADAVWQPCPWSLKWADPAGLNFGDELADPAGWASMQDACRIAGSGTVYLNATMPTHTFAVFCTRVLHEVGHLVGAVHSSNQRSVMFPEDRGDEGWTSRHGHRVWSSTWADPRCRDRGRPYLEQRGVLRARDHQVPRRHVQVR